MKRINKIFGLSLSVAAVFGLASCSNEVSEPNDNGVDGSVLDKVELVKTPDVVAWSGSTYYSNPLGTKGTWTDEATGKVYYQHDDEVEVNLSINDTHDYDVADLIAKLSIHVRKASDVTVTLPLTTNYIIESDDLYIFQKHYEGVYGNDFEASNALLSILADDEVKHILPLVDRFGSGTNVELAIEFKADQAIVTITGVTPEILDKCYEDNHDGLNFEVYLYLQDSNAETKEAAKDALKDDLDESTVEFTGEPTYYINAFGYKYVDGKKTTEINPYDCKVSLVDDLAGSYTLLEGYYEHVNGTKYNKIYVLQDEEEEINPDHAHGGPVETTPATGTGTGSGE